MAAIRCSKRPAIAAGVKTIFFVISGIINSTYNFYMFKIFIRKNKKALLLSGIGVVAGSLAGFFYWKYVGCNSGTCAIWSNPTKATLYGAMLGGLLLFSFVPDSSSTNRS